MGRASSSKKVSRAASTGGGRTGGKARPYGWWISVTVVVVLGVLLVAASRSERRKELAADTGRNVAPRVGSDHWHAAYGVYLCDRFVPPITSERDPKGIHTHNDGVIHIHPSVRSAAGANARLRVFAEAVGMELSDTELELPGGKAYKEGKTKCGDEPGEVQVLVDGERKVLNDVADIRFTDRQSLTIAFAPRDAELTRPPSVPKLDDLDDVPGSSPPATAGGDTSTTAPADESTSTTTADGTTTTSP